MAQRVIVDLRSSEEFAKDHVDGALNITAEEVVAGNEVINNLPKDTEIILYCISGARSNTASNILRQNGFNNVINGINKDQVRAKYGI